MDLPPGQRNALLLALSEEPKLVVRQVEPTLQEWSGLDAPPGGFASGLSAAQLEHEAGQAWSAVREGDQEQLRALAEQALAAEDPAERGRVLEQLCRRLPVKLLMRHEGLRRLVCGEHGATAPKASGPRLGLLSVFLAFVFGAAAGGYFAVRPTPDILAPKLELTQPAEGLRTAEATVVLEGVVHEQTLVEVLVAGLPARLIPERDGVVRFRHEWALPTVGSHTIKVVARDAAGRTTEAVRTVQRIPRPLRVVLTSPAEGFTFRGGVVEVRGHLAGPTRELAKTLRVNGAPVAFQGDTAFRCQVTIEAREGSHPIEVEVEGPQAKGGLTRQVLVDRTPPVLTISALPADYVEWGDVVDLTLNVRDASPWVRIESPGGAPRKVSPNTPVVFGAAVNVGQNDLQLVAVDAAGNRSQPARVRVTRKQASELLDPFRTKRGRYEVTRELVIEPGRRLVIPPGSRLEFKGGVGLICRGELRAPGRKTRPIVLSGKSWRGLTIEGTEARAVLSWTTIEDAKKPKAGGGVYVRKGGGLEATDCLIRRCSASKYGGGLYVLGAIAQRSKATCRRVRFVDNRSNEGAGANVNNGSQVELRECSFQGNTARGSGGGLIAIGTAKLEATDNRFLANSAQWGGGVYVGSGAEVHIRGGELSRNSAKHRGGGLYLEGSAKAAQAEAKLLNVRFQSNNSPEGGGANINMRARCELVGCHFASNQGRLGAGILVIGTKDQRSELLCRNVLFEANRASGDGGAVNVNNYGSARLERCQFARNVSKKWGGAVMAIGKPSLPSVLELVACSFRGNRATRNGGPDLRVAQGVLFDTAQLAANRLYNASRYSLHRSHRVPPRGRAAPRLDAEKLVRSNPLGNRLKPFIRCAVRKDFSALRGRRVGRSGSTYRSKTGFPGASSVFLKQAGRRRGRPFWWVKISLASKLQRAAAEARYRRLVGQIKGALASGWQEREQVGRRGKRTRSFQVGSGADLVVIRVELSGAVQFRRKQTMGLTLTIE